MNKIVQTVLCGLLALFIMMSCKRDTPDNHSHADANKDSVVIISHEFVFAKNQPFIQCHASTVLHAPDGNFLIAWFGGTHEKHDDVGIWLTKGKPGRWSKPVEIAKLREDPHWNPVLFRRADGTIILYFKVGKTIDHWETWYKTSSDNGETWTDAKELVEGDKGGRGPVRNKPIILSDGTWLAPASDEKKGVWNAFVDRSEDGGNTWTASPFFVVNRDSIPEEGVIQPTLWESSPGNVHALLRSSAGVICRSDSKDYGKTWSTVYKTTLPNPNSGIDLTKFEDGTLALVYNRDGKNWGARRPIAVAISTDNGKTWPTSVDLETGNGEDEFSYPSIIHTGDTIALTYTWKRESIAFWLLKRGL
jgi:predicted neuraminidase